MRQIHALAFAIIKHGPEGHVALLFIYTYVPIDPLLIKTRLLISHNEKEDAEYIPVTMNHKGLIQLNCNESQNCFSMSNQNCFLHHSGEIGKQIATQLIVNPYKP